MKSKRLPARKRSVRRFPVRKMLVPLIVLVVVVFVVLGLWSISHAERWSITSIEVSGISTVLEADVRAATEEALAGQHAGVISRRFAPFLSESSVRASVEALPRVERADVWHESGVLSIFVTEDEPEAVWCGPLEEECHFINEAGVAYAAAPMLRGGTVLRVLTAEPPTIGQTLLEPQVRGIILRFADTLRREHNLAVVRIEHLDGDIHFVLAGGGKVITSPLENFDVAYQNLVSILASEEFEHLDGGTFEYIDLRFSPKVFVRERAPIEAVATSTTDVVVATTTPNLVE